MLVYYANMTEVYVTTKDNESALVEKLKESGYDLEPEDGDFDRVEVESPEGIVFSCSNQICVENTV